jgi:hypothetical protein
MCWSSRPLRASDIAAGQTREGQLPSFSAHRPLPRVTPDPGRRLLLGPRQPRCHRPSAPGPGGVGRAGNWRKQIWRGCVISLRNTARLHIYYDDKFRRDALRPGAVGGALKW